MYRSSTLGLCITLCSLAPARAAIITVTSDSGGTGGPDCTLRDAITAANTDTPTGGCPAGNGADTIELPIDATITLTMVDNDTDGPNGLPSVTNEITLNGNGATIQRDARSAPDFRIFQITAGSNLTLSDLTLSGGAASGVYPASLGGAIFDSGGTTTMTNCRVTGNSATFIGGGIFSIGALLTLIDCTVSDNLGSGVESAFGPDGLTTMIITNCTVSGNTTSNRGGGIVNSGILNLSSSNVKGNTADRGGGIANFWMMTMINSIVSGNTADGGNGGGIFNSDGGTVTLINSNVNGNSANGNGGGIFSTGNSTATLTESIVCGNTPDQIDGPWTDNGGNLIADECPPCVSADLNGDGIVEAADLAELLGDWGPCPEPPEPCPADLMGTGDGFVGADDLAFLLGAWGPCP